LRRQAGYRVEALMSPHVIELKSSCRRTAHYQDGLTGPTYHKS
jgi:hypothetical protein